MSKKFFRPPPQLDDDDDDDDSDEEELVDDDDDDDDEEDNNAGGGGAEEEEEEEEDGDERRRNKGGGNKAGPAKRSKTKDGGGRKRSRAAAFFDEEAEASDDEEEEDDDDDEGGRHGSSRRYKEDEGLDEEAKELIRQQDRRRAQAGRFGERTVAEMARDIEQRHRLQQRRVDVRTFDRPLAASASSTVVAAARTAAAAAVERASIGGGGSVVGYDGGSSVAGDRVAEAYTAVAQQSLMPSVSDPSLWMVSCMTGKEQELVYQIMNKCVAYARQGKPLGISAAIAAQSKGKIYVESFSEPAVKEAIQSVRGIMQYTMRLVPIQDMTTVLTVTSTKKPVQKNDWVRMTRGHYKGDLALVKAVKESGLKCIIQCVPRLDYALADLPPEEARARRRTVRPPQKFFNAQEVAALGRQSMRRQRFPGLDLYCDYYEGNYYHDGYLLKEMTVGSMVKPITEEDPPTLDELTRFQRRKAAKEDGENEDGNVDDNEGSKMAASLLDELSELQGKTSLSKSAAPGGGLIIGDTVEVIEGDLVGMRGKIVTLDETTVKIKPLNASIDLGGMDEVEFLARQVRKYIAVGAHVKVIDGRYANETGVVVAVEQLDGETDFTAVILTDVTSKEISVRTSQVRESAEVASGQDRLQGYELYDLVVLSGGGSANEVGVIVRVGREDFTVVNNHGIAREVRPEELRGKRNSTSSRAVALDVSGNQMRCGDTVNVAEGPHKGKSATIKRMSRAQLFLHSQTRTEHAGIFVVRGRSCILAGSRNQNRSAGGDGGVSPFSTPQSQNRGGPAAGRGKRDDGLVGKTVRIQAGQWKGYIGTVTDSTATHVQIELHSRLKKIMVVRERVAVVGDKFGATEQQDASAVAAAAPTPMTMATPMHVAMGGATPAIHSFGGATPMHDADGGDEVWRPGGSIDQENIKEDEWGASPSESTSQFTATTKEEDDGGWGSSSVPTSEWGAAPVVKKDDPLKPDPSVHDRAPKRESDRTSEVGTELADTEETPAWFMERVCVFVKSEQKSAVIKEINADKSAMVEMEDGTVATVRVGDLSMIPPKEHDTVLVTGGNEIGVEGSLVCVDGSDAILKDANDEFKIIDFIHCATIVSK